LNERRSIDLNGLIELALNLAYHCGRAQDQDFTLEQDLANAIEQLGPPIISNGREFWSAI
jgi:hypothetical protein